MAEDQEEGGRIVAMAEVDREEGRSHSRVLKGQERQRRKSGTRTCFVRSVRAGSCVLRRRKEEGCRRERSILLQRRKGRVTNGFRRSSGFSTAFALRLPSLRMFCSMRE
jgi:hypothetical protein